MRYNFYCPGRTIGRPLPARMPDLPAASGRRGGLPKFGCPKSAKSPSCSNAPEGDGREPPFVLPLSGPLPLCGWAGVRPAGPARGDLGCTRGLNPEGGWAMLSSGSEIQKSGCPFQRSCPLPPCRLSGHKISRLLGGNCLRSEGGGRGKLGARGGKTVEAVLLTRLTRQRPQARGPRQQKEPSTAAARQPKQMAFLSPTK